MTRREDPLIELKDRKQELEQLRDCARERMKNCEHELALVEEWIRKYGLNLIGPERDAWRF